MCGEGTGGVRGVDQAAGVCARACVCVCVCLLASVCVGAFNRLQLKAREGGIGARGGRLSSKMIDGGQPEEPADAYVLQNLKRIKMFSSCQLVHVTASALFAHACLLQDCSTPAAAAVQFDCAANLLQWLQQPSLRAASLLRAVECEWEGGGGCTVVRARVCLRLCEWWRSCMLRVQCVACCAESNKTI